MPETTAKPLYHSRKWILRSVWVVLFFVILLTLPEPRQAGLSGLLSRAALSDLFGGWSGAVRSHGEEQVAAPAATKWDLFRSFFVGEKKALPQKPPHRLPFVLGNVTDDTVSTSPWTRERVHALLAGDAFEFLDVLDESDAASSGLPIIDVGITAQDSTVVARARSRSGGSDLPALFVRPSEGAPLETTPLAGLTSEGSASSPSPYSVVPPLVAIFLALITRRAVWSLFFGIVAGAIVIALQNGGGFAATVTGSADAVRSLYWNEIDNQFRLSIILFVLFLVGMVGVLTRVGGTQGLVNLLTRFSEGVKSTRIVTALMGFIVFFDDYSNSVIVGSSMRPLCDRMRIAREKLAYLIDSTAAPVAGIALFSTWIGYEVSQYQTALREIDPEMAAQAYSLFLQTIPLRFYCIFTLIFVLANVFLARDYGSMWRAEYRAAKEGKLIADGAQPLTTKEFAALQMKEGLTPRARNAIAPLLTVIVFMVVGFWFVGEGIPRFREDGFASLSIKGIGDILGNDYIMPTSVVAAFVGSIVAIVLATKSLSWGEAIGAWFVGCRSIGIAVVILFSAWAIAGACGELSTNNYLGSFLAGQIDLIWLPVGIFLLSCGVAFATGTSWGTMAILIPVSIPIVFQMEGFQTGNQLGPVTLLSLAAVLEGSIFGDHCSPISDTTVLASASAGSDHIDHVRTQVPYAITTMLIAMFIGYIPVANEWYSPWVALPVGAALCVAVLLILGRPTPEPDPGDGAAPETSSP